MNYQEMLDELISQDDSDRTLTIAAHGQEVFSDGFIGFVQGQIAAGRAAIQPGSPMEQVLVAAGMDPAPLMESGKQYLDDLLAVWARMQTLYAAFQRSSEQQGNTQGMVAHGGHTTMPAGVSVDSASTCYRCGSRVEANGLCGSCVALDQDIEHHRLEDDNLRYERQLDDQAYLNNQRDFNDPDY